MNVMSSFMTYFIFAVLTICFAMLPFVGRKNLAFGITIPKSEYNSVPIKKARREFLFWMVAVGMLAMVIAGFFLNPLPEGKMVNLFTVMIVVQVLAYGMIYYTFYRRIKRLKAEMGWQISAQEIAVADTKFAQTHKTACSPNWFWLYLLVVGATAALGIIFYDVIPDKVPLQMDSTGTLVKFADKSPVSVFFPVVMQALMSGVFIFVYYTFKRTPPVLDAENVTESSRQNAIFRYRWSLFTVFGGLAMLLIFGSIMLSNIGIADLHTVFTVSMVAVVVIIAYAVILSVTTGQSGSRVKPEGGQPGQQINRDDDRYWKAGSFYYNKEDPAMFVEKRFGIGTTVNFANPWAVAIFVGVIVIVVGISIAASILMK